MSIGGTPFNSDQLLGQLQGLQRGGLGNRQLVLDSNGAISAKASLFERFCNLFSSKPSSPQQGNAFQKFQAILEQDYRSVGQHVLSLLGGNKKTITVNEAIGQIKLAKDKFQQWQQKLLTNVQQAVEYRFASDWKPSLLQQVLPQMMHALQLKPGQEPLLYQLIMGAQDAEEIWNLAHEAMRDPADIKKHLSQVATLSSELQPQAHSDLLLRIDRQAAISRMHQLLRLGPEQTQVLHELISTNGPKEIFAFVNTTQSNPKAAYDFLSNLATLPKDSLSEELLSSLKNIARSNLVEAQRLGSAFAKMMECVNPNEAQKQVLLELVRCVNISRNPKAVLTFAYAAINNPEGVGKFLSNLSKLTKDEQLKAFSYLFEKGEISFARCTICFYNLSNTDPIADAANEIHTAMQSNPTTNGFTRATQCATEIAKHLITVPGQLANESFIATFKNMLAEGIILPGTNNAFVAQQLDRLLNDPGLQAQLLAIGRNGISPVAHQAIRETLGLPPDAPITAKEAQQAALAALLAPLRQGNVGSCFATAVAINMHDTRPAEMLRDMAALIEKGYMERQNGFARVQIPFNQSPFKSPTPTGTASVPTGNQMASSQQASQTTGNPLLRCWEYTLATSAESQLGAFRNQQLGALACQVLGSIDAYSFMRCVSFTYDASKTITNSADGHSSMGAFKLGYTSPHSGQKFEIQTAEHLRWALQEFSGRPLMVGPQVESHASRLLKALDGGFSEDILQAQYGIQDLHKTTVQNFQNLPYALLDIAGKIASEAQQRGVPVPSYAPMRHQRHAFNIRLNDPILQEGIRIGAWESPQKRQDFLRQQLMEPMQAKTLDPKRASGLIFRFFYDLENRLASLKDAPSKDALEKVFGRITGELKDKCSYADLAKAAYNAIKQEFPQIPDTTLQENIMMALAPRCPQMMFADTNWQEDGKPVHWGIQFNPITEQFGIVQGIQNDAGKYVFGLLLMSESRFGECTIIDDPRVLFRT
ncbi:MAG: hypothetical protein LBD69_02830 [Puniceicoccales bacterium]|jgi:hypothetical protein|nr:hypothetical protein [Puniceicoccales bacterium]